MSFRSRIEHSEVQKINLGTSNIPYTVERRGKHVIERLATTHFFWFSAIENGIF
jgi:hypothetical protein